MVSNVNLEGGDMANAAAEISNLGYVVLGVRDLGAWADFAHNLMGFHVCSPNDNKVLTLRVDEYARRIVLEQGDEDDILEAGWEFESEEELGRYVAQLRQKGVSVERAGLDYEARRGVEVLFHCSDPNGFRHAFYFGPEIAPMTDPFRSRVLHGAGFETGVLGLG